MSIAGRAGAWSAAHWKTATVGWLALVAVALVAGQTVGTRMLSTAQQSQGGSARAETILARAGTCSNRSVGSWRSILTFNTDAS